MTETKGRGKKTKKGENEFWELKNVEESGREKFCFSRLLKVDVICSVESKIVAIRIRSCLSVKEKKQQKVREKMKRKLGSVRRKKRIWSQCLFPFP